MAFIHLPQRWVKQPQCAVGVDSTSPFSNGLVRAFLPPYFIDLAKGTTVTCGSEIIVGVDNGYQSFIHTFGFGYTGITFKEFSIPNGASLLLFQRRFSTEINGWLSISIASTSDHFTYAGGVYSSLFGNTRWINGSNPNITYTNPFVFACSVNSGSQTALLNGKLFIQNNLSLTLGIKANPTLLIANNGYLFNGALYVALMWDRALSFDELVYVSNNPWQIFAPITRVIYFPVASNSAWTLIVANAVHNHSLEQAVLSQANLIALNSAAHSQTADAAQITQASVLTVTSANQSHTLDAVILNTSSTLILSDANQTHTATSVDLAQANLLALFDAAHNHSASLISLTGDDLITPADASQSQSATQPALNQENLLTLFGANHAQITDTTELTQAHLLAIAAANQSHVNDSVELSTVPTLTVSNGTQSNTVDPLALIQAHLLAVSAALHTHNATQANIGQSASLSLDDAAHSNTANALELTQIIVLSVFNALHQQESDLLALSSQITLIINDALHAQLATAAIQSSVTPAGRVFMVASENRLFIVAASSRF